MKNYTALLAAIMAVGTNAHMIMKTPVPAGNPDSSPLPDMSTFPCKGLTSVASGEVNNINVGEPQTLSFTGSAVHGGGSCQVSLASGTTVTKDMKFMVIHSMEGGCPADVVGNLAADPSGSGAAKFQFTVPDHPDLPAGAYTLAWTWNNKIGNREFYMNCANVQLSGAKKKRYAPTSITKRDQAPLPDMFVGNIGGSTCTIAEGLDLKYPNPGASVEQSTDAKLGDPTGGCGAVAAANPAAGSSVASSAGSVATSAPATSNSVSPVGSSSARNSGSLTQSAGGVFATESAAATNSAAVTQAPAASSAMSQSPAASTAAAATPASSAPASSTGACEVGAWDCAVDGLSFTRCVAGGTWSASIAMAAGMSCTPGVSMNFAYNASAGSHAKRDIRSHIARRQHNVHGPALS